MDIGTVSTRYAKALMLYARDHKCEDQLYEAMEMLYYSLSHNKDLDRAVKNPMLDARQRLQLLCTAAYGNGQPHEGYVKFMRLVIRNGREDMLRFICFEFRDLYRRYHNIGSARLTTAVPISDKKLAELDKLTSTLLHTDMKIEPEVDPSIIGGFIFDAYGYRLDASVSTQLRKVKDKLLDMNRRIV